MKPLRSILPPALLFATIACASTGGPAYETPISMDEVTTAHVRNLNTYSVSVYLVQPGLNYWLGSIESMSSDVFAVPPKVMNGRLQYRLVADPLGPHPTFMSETFMLQPGQSANWKIHEAQVSLVAVH